MFEDIVYNVGKTVNDVIGAVFSMVPQSSEYRPPYEKSAVRGGVVVNRETAAAQAVPASYAASQNGRASGGRYGLKFN